MESSSAGSPGSVEPGKVDGPAAAPGVYPAAGSATGLRYWNGTGWDSRPVARTWTRVWCTAIDNLLASLLWFILTALVVLPLVFLGSSAADEPPPGLGLGLLIVAFVGYFAASYHWWGRTPGMMLGRLYVVHIPTGVSRLRWGTAIGRAAGLLLGYMCGVFTIIWLAVTASSRTKQGPHDSWAHTAVLADGRDMPVVAVPPPVAAGQPATTQPSTVQANAEQQTVIEAQTPITTPEPVQASESGTVFIGEPRPRDSTLDAPSQEDGSPAAANPAVATAPVVTPDRPSRRSRKKWVITGVIALVFLLAGAVAGAIYVDSRIRLSTMTQLVDATQASEAVLYDYRYDERWEDLAARLNADQARAGQTEQYYQDVWRDFVQETTDVATEYVEPVQKAILDVEAVQTLPWHSDIAEARDAYLEHANVWLDAISARTKHTPEDQRVLGLEEGRGAEMRSTWAVTERRYKDVTILWMPSGLERAINQLFY